MRHHLHPSRSLPGVGCKIGKRLLFGLAMTGIALLLQGCVIAAAAIGAQAYANHETKRSISRAVNAYQDATQRVRLGDSREEVLRILEPTQAHLKPKLRKASHRFRQGGIEIEIDYFRSSWRADGVTTDDEFTPYIFEDGRLANIGWAKLGGPRTHGRGAKRLPATRE